MVVIEYFSYNLVNLFGDVGTSAENIGSNNRHLIPNEIAYIIDDRCPHTNSSMKICSKFNRLTLEILGTYQEVEAIQL